MNSVSFWNGAQTTRPAHLCVQSALFSFVTSCTSDATLPAKHRVFSMVLSSGTVVLEALAKTYSSDAFCSFLVIAPRF